MDCLGWVVLTLAFGSVLSAEWSYIGSNGPAYWKNSFPECGADSQSPINIFEGDVAIDGITESFTLTNYDTTEGLSMTLTNNGHTAVVGLSSDTLPEVSGGGLGGTFRAAQFHFHWGHSDEHGSEHFISSTAYPLELHIVHYNTIYPSLSRAANESDGLAVLGFMFEVSSMPSRDYGAIINGLYRVKEEGASVDIGPVTMSSLIPTSLSHFYRYQGSLTTPGCFESVTWTVFKDTIKMTEEQLEVFRGLMDYSGNPVLDNYRPIQALNGRVVQASYDPEIQWSYDYGHVSSDHWSEYYQACGAEKQSPINIPTTAATVMPSLGNLTFSNYDTTTGVAMTLSNNGHAVKVDVTQGTLSIQGGGLSNQFNVAQFHFHWGSTSLKGSEHTTNSIKYPMELHIVHYNSSLGDLGTAAVIPNGLAVLGIFFEISNEDNPNLDPIINNLINISEPYSSVSIPPFQLETLLPANTYEFYRYEGSLTTPGCYETVIWTVLHDTITVSESQMSLMRSLNSSDKNKVTGEHYSLVDNFRPVQNLNLRSIYSNFQPQAVDSPAWSYIGSTGPEYWKDIVASCENTATSRQSPINIIPTTVSYDNSFLGFTFQGFDSTDGVTMTLTNNGHAVVVSYTAGNPTVRHGGLKQTHIVAQFHFHWGSDDSMGSEHTINGDSYPMEMHIVTYNTIYNSLGVAASQSNGLAVLGFLFEDSDTDNENFKPLVDALSNVTTPKTTVPLTAFSLDSLLPQNVRQFYRYDGSLTTPGCYESVTWTLFRAPIPISKTQLDEFRSLKSSDKNAQNEYLPLENNFRPPQPLNARTVRANFLISASRGLVPSLGLISLSFLFIIARFAYTFL